MNDHIYRWLESNGGTLQYFRISEPYPDNNSNGYLDEIIKFMPRLRHLNISHEYISEEFFETFGSGAIEFHSSKPTNHPLEILELDFQNVYRVGNAANLRPSMVLRAFNRGLGNLKIFRYHSRFGWWDDLDKRGFLLHLCAMMIHEANKRGEGGQVAVTMFHEEHDIAFPEDPPEETMDWSNLPPAYLHLRQICLVGGKHIVQEPLRRDVDYLLSGDSFWHEYHGWVGSYT